MKEYIVKREEKNWVVMEHIETTSGGHVKLISIHSGAYEAWKEARRLARGAGGKATLNKNVSNIYAHAEDDDV